MTISLIAAAHGFVLSNFTAHIIGNVLEIQVIKDSLPPWLESYNAQFFKETQDHLDPWIVT